MKKRKTPAPRPVFDNIRKPTAPPNQKIGQDKPEEKIHPSRRKAKHKKRDAPEN
ncbi:MAG: hypothetical protein H0U87_01115 [Acidobacteria bacterium]|jgi:hypothetical protein|nr:hypothetical protein [Acidobacteriota bacterium]